MRHCSTNRLLPMIQKNLMVLTINKRLLPSFVQTSIPPIIVIACKYLLEIFTLFHLSFSVYASQLHESTFFFYLVTVAQKSQSFTDIIALLHVLYIPQKNRYSLMSFETQVDVIDQALILANFSQLELTFLGLNFFCQNLIKVKL